MDSCASLMYMVVYFDIAERYMKDVIKNRDDDALTFLIDNKCGLSEKQCKVAFETNNYLALRLLRQNGCEWKLIDDETNRTDKLKCLEFAYDALCSDE